MAGLQNCLDGKIDEVAIWSAGLTNAEVLAIYNGGRPGNLGSHSRAASLEHWWRMGDGTGDVYPTVADQVGSADGTMTNMTSGAVNFVADVP
jgi:hypothetical protein